MARFCFFVDGSNLFGSLTSMNLSIDDYQAFYLWLFALTRDDFGRTRVHDAKDIDELLRIYWYVVGSIDDWDLDNAKSQATLRDAFDRDGSYNAAFMADAGRKLAEAPTEKASADAVRREAWALAFKSIREWYEARKETLANMKRFHHALRASTDFIDIIEVGHWKVDFFTSSMTEKGLDAALSVDMVTQVGNYDVAVVVSGDADMLPSIRYAKGQGKHVCIVEFVPGYPPDDRGRGMSSRLRLEGDFVTRVYEMELVQKGLASKRS